MSIGWLQKQHIITNLRAGNIIVIIIVARGEANSKTHDQRYQQNRGNGNRNHDNNPRFGLKEAENPSI